MKYCSKCVLPDSRPGIFIDESTICSGCKNNIFIPKKIDWEERKLLFKNFIYKLVNSKTTSEGNLSVVPVSGGKDSTIQVVRALEFGLKPIAVTWKSPGRTDHGQLNLDNISDLGVDHIDFKINPQVEKQFTYKCFQKLGNPSIPMHLAIHSIPLFVAKMLNIPLILWAENPAFTIGTDQSNLDGPLKTKEWFTYFGGTMNTVSSDWIDKNLTKDDLYIYSMAGKSLSDIKEIFLGYYFPWNPHEIAKSAEKYGKKLLKQSIVGIHDFSEDDDSFLMPVTEWLKWHKFGITRTWDNLSIDIRLGKITRDDAISKILKLGYERPNKAIQEFCKYLNITESKFDLICDSFRSGIWSKQNGKWTINNFLIENWKWNEKVLV